MALSPSEQAAIDAVNGKTPPPPKTPGAPPLSPKPLAGPGPWGAAITNQFKSPTDNPLAPLVPVVTGAARAVGTPVGKIFDVLNRTSAANQARQLRGPKAGAQTLVHSESPDQYTSDTAEMARRDMANRPAFSVAPFIPAFGPNMGQKPMTKQEYDAMPGWWHQAVETLTQIRHDPLTYAGGAGILEHLADAVGTRSFLTFTKAVADMQRSDNKAIQSIGHGLGHAYDVTHYKGAVQRDLANQFGQEGIHFFRGLRAINNARRTKSTDLINSLLDQYDQVTKGLKPQEEADLYSAIHGGTVAQLDPQLQMRAAKFKQVTDSLAHLEGTEGLQHGLAHGVDIPGKTINGRPPLPGEVVPPVRTGGGFELNKNLSRFDTGPTPNLFRRQKAGDIGASPVTGGTFYYKKGAVGLPRVGGKVFEAIKNPSVKSLTLDAREPLGQQAAARMGIAPVPKLVPNADKSRALEYLRSAGLSQRDSILANNAATRQALTAGTPNKISQAYSLLIQDAAVAGKARSLGYGAIETPDEYFALLPESATASRGGPRGLQNLSSYRPHYVPTRHEAVSSVDRLDPHGILGLDQTATADARSIGSAGIRDLQHSEPEAARTTSSVDREDPNLLQRGEGARLMPPKIQRKIIESRFKGGAQAIAAHDAEQQATKLFGKARWSQVPDSGKEFFRETWAKPGGKEFFQNLAKGSIDIPKIGLFALPFRHIANISTLAALADPGALPGTLGNYAHLMVMGTGSQRGSRLLNKLGLKGAGDFLDPAAAAGRKAKILGKAGEYGVTGTPSVDRRAAAGWLGKIPGIGDIYKASNHALWTFDDAAKATRFNRLLRKYKTEGMDESHAAVRAADQVGAELIDYSNASPLTEFMRYLAPFATYRSKAPAAVVGSVMRHPERTLLAGRRSPELVGDLQQGPPNAKGQPQVGKSYLPLAETLRGAEYPMQFVRSTAGWPISMTASLIGKKVQHDSGVSAPDIAFYMTYGKDPNLKYLANALIGTFPGGEAGLGAIGRGEFANQGSLSGAIRGQTGFGLSRGPSPTQVMLPSILQQAQDYADKTRKTNPTQADAIEKAIERVKERYRLFVP